MGVEPPASEPTLNAERFGPFRLGPWRVDPASGRLRTDGREVELPPRPLALLLALVEADGAVVGKEHLHQRVWGARVVGDDVQRRALSELRRALGDDARAPRFVETLPRRGYRLLVPAVPEEKPIDAGPVERWKRPEPRPWTRWLATGLVSCLGVWGVLALRESSTTDPVGAHERLSSTPTSPVRELTTRPLTTLPGRESQPALSRDGKSLAFVAEGESGHREIWVQDLTADAPALWTRDSAQASSPAFSPDAQELAWVRRGERTEVVIRPLLGVGTRVLASWPASAAVGGIAFSPRGESLVFSLRESSEGPARIVRLSLEDKALEELTAPPITSLGDTLPAFSPDGSQVAFVRRSLKNAHDVYTVPVEGGVAVRRSVLEGKIPGLAWSTAGLFLTRFPAGRQSLWRLDPETGDTTRWTLPARFPTRLAAAGARVVVTDSGNDSDIAVVSGGEVRRRIRSTAWDASPHLSTSAGRLVFFSSRSGNGEIWSSDLESGELRRLTRFDGSLALHPRLSPDGRRLAFDRRRNDRSDIYLMDLGGGEPRALVDTWGNDLLPTWSLDGETIYFVSDRGGRWGLWSRPADGSGSPRFLAEGWCFALEDPATGGLVVSRQKAPGLWFLRAPAGESGVPAVFEPWAEAPVPAEWGLWALEGHRVVAVTRRQSRYLLEAFDRRTGQTEELARLPASPENPGLAVAGERVWLGLAAPPEADLLLVEGL